MNRGIVAAPGNINIQISGFSLSPNLTPEDIRFYLLYWDKIVIPTNNLVHFGIPDEDDLIASGAIWRPRIQHQGGFQGNEIGKAIIKGQCDIAELMMKDKKTDWVIHQSGSQLYLPEESSSVRNTIRVDLAGALPVPGNDVNINDVLEFKQRRSDELGALHEALDNLYLEILQSPDKSLSTKKAFTQLEADIENLNKASNETYKTSRKFDLSTELNFNGKDTAIASAGGAFVDYLASGFTIPVVTTIAALASLVKVSGKATKTFTHASENKKLSYLSHASKEGVINKNS